jgi:calcineurin-like phosphoesterase family protein
MNFWVLADPHLGHRRIQEPELGGRPEGFEEIILKNLTDTVVDCDVLICLGDVCFYKEEYWHDRLMTSVPTYVKKWLIRGNHDKKTVTWYLEHGWDCVTDQMLLFMFGQRILLSHIPAAESHSFDVNVHGHYHHPRHHEPEPEDSKRRLVYLEHEYMPINQRRLVEC